LQSEVEAPPEEYPLTKVKLDDLIYDKTNPNRPSKEVIEGIRKSILEFGLVKPIVINEKMEIADGEHRALVWKALGKTDIQAYIVPKLNDDIKRRLARQTLNKLQGEHDIKLDADEMALIFEAGQLNNLAELIAQGRESLENILTKHKGIQFQHEDNFDVDKALEDLVPETQLGDIWQLGQHRIICADCTDKRSIDRLLEDKQAELLLTDPPYGISIVQLEGSSIGGSKPVTIGRSDASNIVEANWYRPIANDDKDFDPKHLLSLGKNQIIFGGNYFADKLPISSGWLVWYKRHEEWDRTTFAECELMWSSYDIPARFYNVVWMGLIKEGEGGKRLHPTQKPIKLLADLIKDFTKEGDNVLDTYLGSGSTLIACEQTNRVCYGVEIDPHYVDVCCKRYEAYTGAKATLLPREDVIKS
jgi:site-specific DNA-methyltransferase (adenine-specific)